jgi:Zn-dependent protease with chaperone function
MGRRGWILALCLLSAPAWCQEDIVDVLRRSQDTRLQALALADPDGARAVTVQRSFDTLLRALQPAPSVEFRVVRGPVVAETLHGHIIVASEDLAEMPESVRLFVLAHELAHVVNQHWLQTALLYQKWIPGPVTPAHTDPVAARLGREASAMAHEQEFAADAFAAHLLHALGHDDDLIAVFRQLGPARDSATHPATRKRIASLRALALSPTPATRQSTR